MTPMIFVSEARALEGGLITSLRQANPAIPVFNRSEQTSPVFGSPDIPAWVQPALAPVPLERLTTSFYKSVARERGVDAVLAVGASAITAAKDLELDLPLVGLIPRGSVDFSKRRRHLLAEFQAASSAADLLFFDSKYEMDKAVSHGSRSPHFLLPLVAEGSNFLADSQDEAIVSVVVPSEWTEDRKATVYQEFAESSVGEIATLDLIGADELYSRTDYELSRGFPGSIRYRLRPGTTHIVLMGNSASHSAILAALERNHPHQYVVEATITNRELILRSGIDAYKMGQGASLVQALHRIVKLPRQHAVDSSVVSDGSQLLTHFSAAVQRSVPWWFEEGICDPDTRQVDVFFSVAAIEDRADGARPQRIRAVSETFGSDGVLNVRLSPNENIFERRTTALLGLVKSGVRPRYFYGENSTAPMQSVLVDRLADLIRRLRSSGMRTAWFVRDLHWLSADADYSTNGDVTPSERIARGLYENESMSQVSELFYAPSDESVAMFEELLESQRISGITWSSLPPGIADYRVVHAPREKLVGPVKFVYSGGYGDVYNMDTLIASIGQSAVQHEFQWFVRTEDTDRLTSDLLKSYQHRSMDRDINLVADTDSPGSAESARSQSTELTSIEEVDQLTSHHINNREFLSFDPGDDRYVGLILLDSSYALRSFPFKLMSYLEKKIPVAVFDDMGVADFVQRYGVGVVCSRDNFSLSYLAGQVEEFYSTSPNWDDVIGAHSWVSRMEGVKNSLRLIDE